MYTKNDHIEQIIDKLNEGQLISSEERAELNRWAALSPENAARLHEEEEIMAATEAAADTCRIDTEAAFMRFLSRIRDEQDDSGTPRRRTLRWWAAAAAVAVLLVITGITAYESGIGAKATYGTLTASAPAGSTATVTLPDGTTVNLNSGSRITYSQGYGIADRKIRLEGQGYFIVAHDDKMPMTVTTGSTTVSDIGTEFDLSDYADDNEATVCVTEGAVGIDARGDTSGARTVSKGYTARLDKATGRVSIEPSPAENPYQWRTGTVKLTGQSMQEIAAILSRAYGATILLKGRNAEGLHFNGEFNLRICSLTDVLEALAATNNLTYTVKGSTVEIR